MVVNLEDWTVPGEEIVNLGDWAIPDEEIWQAIAPAWPREGAVRLRGYFFPPVPCREAISWHRVGPHALRDDAAEPLAGHGRARTFRHPRPGLGLFEDRIEDLRQGFGGLGEGRSRAR